MNVDDFLKLRCSEKFSGESITIWIDELPRPMDVFVPETAVKRINVFAFAGLAEFIHAKSYTPALVALVDRVKAITGFVLVAITDFGDELGWKVINGEPCEL